MASSIDHSHHLLNPHLLLLHLHRITTHLGLHHEEELEDRLGSWGDGSSFQQGYPPESRASFQQTHYGVLQEIMFLLKGDTILSAERIENRLKKPTTFICKLKFRNELPDPTEQRKLMSLKRDKDRISKYRITALEKLHKPQLYVESDLGIPLGLLDLSVYNPSKGEVMYLDPEDELLLRDDDPVIPIKEDGIIRKNHPTDQGVSWLVKTQYISPLSTDSTKQSFTEKQAKDLRDTKRPQHS